MSFVLVGVCCDTLFFLVIDILMLSFNFCRREFGDMKDGLKAMDTGLGSLESKVSLEEISQHTCLGSSSE